jgi:1,2-dihydroxy-3-keto-5-methylthiopentene dioxygenase
VDVDFCWVSEVCLKKDRWVRVVTGAGQLIVLPAGMYHRFVPDEKIFFHTMRLFQDEPKWTAYNRGNVEADKSAARAKYVETFLNHLK